MKKNKLIAFVTALSMTASMGISMISASANDDVNSEIVATQAVTKGFELEYNADASTETTRVIDVYYRGVPDILSAKVKFVYPAGTVTGATYVSTIATQPTVVLDNMAAGVINVVYGGMQGETSPNNQLGNLTITVPETTGEFVLELGECEIFNGNFQEETGLDPCSITIPAYSSGEVTEEPSEEATEEATEAPTEEVETPYPITRPTPIPVPTEEPTATPVATAEPVTKGFELEYDVDASTETTRVINVYYRGVPDILSAKVKFEYPAGTVTGATYVSTIATQPTVVLDNMAAGIINVVYGGMQGETSPNNQLGTLTITVPENTGEFVLQLGDCEIFNGNFQEETDLDPHWITIPAYSTTTEEPSEEPTETETPTFDNDGELNLSDIVTDAPAEYEGGKLIAVVIDVTIDGETAEYDTDFVVEYDNKVLTADEYYNLINGYTEPDMAKVISGLKFLVNDGVNVYAAPAYQTTEQEATGEMTVVPSYGGEATYETATEEPEDGTSRLTVSDPSNGDIRIDYTDADGSHVSKTTADGKITVDVPDGTEVEFTAIPKSGYTFSKWGGDLSGTANPDTLTITRDRSVTATFERAGSSDGGSSSSSGGSSSTGNATGGIARPNGGTTSPGSYT